MASFPLTAGSKGLVNRASSAIKWICPPVQFYGFYSNSCLLRQARR